MIIIKEMKDLVQNAYQLFGIRLMPDQVNAFETFERELLEWNDRFNLTAIQEPQQIRLKHFLDSLSCLPVMRDGTMKRVIDVGTGAGFPGIPLKIACPSIQLTLVESIGKKASFCQYMVERLEMQDVEIVRERAEALGLNPAHRQQYDWAVARAVAVMPVLAEYLLPLLYLWAKIEQ